MTEPITTAGTRQDSHIHAGMPGGKTFCGLPVSYRPRQSAIVDCPPCERLTVQVIATTTVAEPDRVEELMEEMIAWRQGLIP